MSILQPVPTPPATCEEGEPRSVIEWQPPHIDWNPWLCKSAITPGMKYSGVSPVSAVAGFCVFHSLLVLNRMFASLFRKRVQLLITKIFLLTIERRNVGLSTSR